MKIVRSVVDLRQALEPARGRSTVGFVPTMGALHDGHVSLFRAARAECGVVVASVFVNPTQFTSGTDLAMYPRDEARDAALAEGAGVDVLFAPGAGDVYPPGYATWVMVEGAAEGFEGDFRPGHFRGVATVCLKLFSMVEPQVAYFGQKDAQQVAVIQQMVRDFNLRITLRVMPTIRDADGLALSSRNVRLSADERRRALAIPRALEAGTRAHHAGQDAAAAARALLEHAGLEPEYVAVASFNGRPTLVVAVHVGATRLIDNAPLDAG